MSRTVTTLVESAERPLWDAALTQPGLGLYSSTPIDEDQSRDIRLAANVSDRIGTRVSGSAGFAINDVENMTGRSVQTALRFRAFSGSMSTRMSYNLDSRVCGFGWGSRRVAGRQRACASGAREPWRQHR